MGISKTIFRNTNLSRDEVAHLADGGSVWKEVDENLVMKDLTSFRDAVWNLLLFNGYLKIAGSRIVTGDITQYCLQIPNNEVLSFFKKEIPNWSNQGNKLTGSQDDNNKITLFISYNHHDIEFVKYLKGEKLNHRLENLLNNNLQIHDPWSF